MPRVIWDAPADPDNPPWDRLPEEVLFAAIRIWHERADVDLGAFTLLPLPSQAEKLTAFITPDDPYTIRLLNQESFWRGEVEAHSRVLDFLRDERILSVTAYRMLRSGIPQSHAERLAETLLHEYAHSLTLVRFGNYLSADWQWSDAMPEPILEVVSHSLTLAGKEPDSYNVGELIAEDARRVLTGRQARLNRATFRADLHDISRAWKRAQKVWKWLTK
jgi:hypothetical protein